MRDRFTHIYKTNYWAGRESRSGSGSDLEETRNIRRTLPKLFKKLGIKSMLDIPCGDMNWIKEIITDDMVYIGADVVPDIIDRNRSIYGRWDFMVMDITKDPLPSVDLIFTRDCLGHLSDTHVEMAVENIKAAKPKYFVTTHWPEKPKRDIMDGDWRPINMEHYLDDSFQLLEVIQEDIKDKFLAIYGII